MLKFCSLFLTFICLASAAADDNERTISLGQIETVEIDPAKAKSISVGNPKVIEVEQNKEGDRLRVSALKAGSSAVIVKSANGEILQKIDFHVISFDVSQKTLTIRKLLDHVAGIAVNTVSDKIVIEGDLIDPRDMDRILKVQAQFSGVLNLVKINPKFYESRALQMQEAIHKDPDSLSVRVEFVNDTYLLFGKVKTKAQRERAEIIAQTLLPEILAREAIMQGVLLPGAKKFSLRNLIEVGK